MNPANPSRPADSAQEPVASELAQPVAEAPMAEPPKTVVFTEVPPEREPATTQPNEVPAEPSKHTPTAANRPVVAAPTTAPTKPQKADNPATPTVAIVLAGVIFIVLTVLAYYAYTKSK